MRLMQSICASLVLLSSVNAIWGEETKADKKPASGVYAVLRESRKEKDVLPLAEGEMVVVNQFQYLKKEDREPPRYLVVQKSLAVKLDLDGAPRAEKEKEDVTKIFLKLKPVEARNLERLTTRHRGKQVAIVVGGEVVTVHKIRETIKGGEVQITSCAPGGAKYLLQRLGELQPKK